jgi:hypothetical protein
MLLHSLCGFVRLSIVREIGSRRMDSAVHKVDPDVRFRSEQGIAIAERAVGTWSELK